MLSATARVLVALIVAATAVFVVGVLLERHQTTNEAVETPAQRAAEAGSTSGTGESSGATAGSQSRPNGESGERPSESGSGESGEQHGETGESKPTSNTAADKSTGETAARGEAGGHVESSEKLLGINPESTGLLAVAVVVSVLLAAAVWWRGGSPVVLGVVAISMAAFFALDIREVIHQVNESRTSLAVLAGVVAALHGAAAVVAARAAVAARGAPPPLASAA